MFDWDPSKWIITVLHKLGLVTGLRKARQEDISAARSWILSHHHEPFPSSSASEEEDEITSFGNNDDDIKAKWNQEDLALNARKRNCLLVIDGFVVDASGYLGEHVRGIFVVIVEPSNVLRLSFVAGWF